MRNEQIEILERSIFLSGVEDTFGICHEEIGELLQAINKFKRSKYPHVTNLIAKPTDQTPLTQVKAYNNLCSEIADVKIVIKKMELMLCPERIQISVDRKINRLDKRMQKLE